MVRDPTVDARGNQVIHFVRQQGFKPDLLDIDFLPLRMRVDEKRFPDCVAVEPAHWHIEFFQLQFTAGGLELQEPKTICSCQIWVCKPFLKHLVTGKVTARYDLWVSRPLDLTSPPWQFSVISNYLCY